MNYNKIPQRTIDAINRYVNQKIETGAFLRAVLTNDLEKTILYADGENINVIPEIVSYIRNNIPYLSYGSEEIVNKWLHS